MLFPELSGLSKVWVYTANRELSDVEVNLLQTETNTFVNGWSAHGNGLKARGVVLENRFLVLAADETEVNASGCSIDSSVKFVKSMGTKLNVDFFNRLFLVIRKGDEFNYVHVSELREYATWDVYNPMITALSEFRTSWRIQVSESPFNSL